MCCASGNVSFSISFKQTMMGNMMGKKLFLFCFVCLFVDQSRADQFAAQVVSVVWKLWFIKFSLKQKQKQKEKLWFIKFCPKQKELPPLAHAASICPNRKRYFFFFKIERPILSFTKRLKKWRSNSDFHKLKTNS